MSFLVFASGASVADDTEIYFNTGSSSGNTSDPLRPNVLFILDTSGSMAWNASGTNQSRMQVLKEAMADIVGNVEDINLGLMRFTSDEGGPVLFPVRYIDAKASDTVGEAANENPSYSNRISNGNNDGEELLTDNSVTLSDPTLDIAQTASFTDGPGSFETRIATGDDDAEETVEFCFGFGCFFSEDGTMLLDGTVMDVDEDNIIGLRFTDIDIPPGATIDNAFLDFWVLNQQSGALDMDVRVQIVDNAGSITNFDDDLSSRVYTTGGDDVEWDNIPNPSNNSQVTSPDISNLVQTIVDRSGWNQGQAMLFGLFHDDDGGSRDWYTHNTTGNTGFHPRLRVDYTTLIASPAEQQVTALRFENVNIPQGATVTGANLTVTPQASDSGTAEWTIKAEASDDSPVLATAAGNLSGRSTTTASTTWPVPGTTADTPITSADLISVVQEIVDRPGWCGGNSLTLIITGTGTRRIKSTEQAAAQAPQLDYGYEAGSTSGCYNRTDTAQVVNGNDDAEEDRSSGDMDRDSNDLDFDDDRTIGVRFQNVQVPQDATILEANILFTARESDSNTIAFDITGHDTDDADNFGWSDDDISDRARTTASSNWPMSSWTAEQGYNTPDISAIVQEIVGRGGWLTGNDMVFIFDHESGSGDRHAYTIESSSVKAPRLSIKYQSSGGTEVKTVRQRLLEIIDGLPASGSTPVIETMYEAAKYWRGERARFGKSRNGDRNADLSHPGSYCDAPGQCNGADVDNHPPFGIDYEGGCDPATEWYTNDCNGSEIDGDPDYISPFTSTLSCQKNYQVLLTDGEANSSDFGIQSDIEDEFLNGVGCETENDAGNEYNFHEICGMDIAKFLYENDQSDLDNDQIVQTFSIAFNLNDEGATQFLKDTAREGSGGSEEGFFSASNATDLVSVFTSILATVKDDPTSFAAPSLAINAFNQLQSRDEAYFGLFTPSLHKRWNGNVKKYKICVDSDGEDPDSDADDCILGELLAADGAPAVDPETGVFREGVRSLWSDVNDSGETVLGGAGGELTDYTERTIYTDATDSGNAPTNGTSLSFNVNPGFQIDSITWDDNNLEHVREAVCPNPSTDNGSDCENRMLWLLGKVIVEDDNTDTSDTTRWAFNDVLHSSPGVITYGASLDGDGNIDDFFDKIIVGTNGGGLRMINGDNGVEEWTFLPQTNLEIQQQLFDDPEGTHPYGMDASPTLNVRDVDGDGFIEPTDGDFVHVIAGMRRGGTSIYALDLTADIDSVNEPVVPKFLWRIEGGSGDFSRLAQTWSQPQLARIDTVDGLRNVLIFGGGYDDALDGEDFGTAATGGNDNDGNAIYIVDPQTGDLLLSISGDSTGAQDADIEIPEMRHSIPSRISILDADGDGADDRLYFGDTGGNVWRVDLAANIDPDAGSAAARAGSTLVGRLAAISTAGTVADERRFFEPPSVVQVKDTEFSDAANGEYDYIMLGSGWRSHPLNKDVEDRFYAFRDPFIDSMPAGSGNLADASAYPHGSGPYTHDDLVDVTSSALDSSQTTRESSGWFFDFTSAGSDGEKVLSAATTLAGTVAFTTYNPDAVSNVDLCAAQVGGGNAYNFNVLNASAALDWDGDGEITMDDRKRELGSGIPSDIVPIFTKEGIVGMVGTGQTGRPAETLGRFSGLPRFRTYWYEE